MKTKPTIIIPIIQGFIVRNILLTDVLPTLIDAGAKIVILSPLAQDSGFRREFESKNVLVEFMPTGISSYIEEKAYALQNQLFLNINETTTRRLQRQRRDMIHGKSSLQTMFVRRILGQKTWLLDLIEPINRRLFRHRYFYELLLRHQADIVFSTNPSFSWERPLLMEANRMGITCACLVQSWDNPTTKGMFPVRFERVLVWNEMNKQEILHSYPYFKESQVVITGAPQFDIYFRPSGLRSRDEFFEYYGIPLSSKLVTFATSPEGLGCPDVDYLRVLIGMIESGEIKSSPYLLVRLHPRDKLARYAEFKDKDRVFFDTAGAPNGMIEDGWYPTVQDLNRLAELLKASDVVINIFSTMTIDASACDVPVISLAFDLPQDLSYIYSVRRFQDFEHMRPVIQTGGVRIAYSQQELAEQVNSYLVNPKLSQQERGKIVELVCQTTDGQSGRRVARSLIDLLASS